jgi:hypothetical protein
LIWVKVFKKIVQTSSFARRFNQNRQDRKNKSTRIVPATNNSHNPSLKRKTQKGEKEAQKYNVTIQLPNWTTLLYEWH